jgi:tetratricopeptide (TPR) repeat protein
MNNVALSLFLVSFLNTWILISQDDSADKRVQVAKGHLQRAREYASFNDPRAENEYKLAIKTCGSCKPEAYQEFSLYLQHHLRFSEAATALNRYIIQTPGKNHTDDLADLAKLTQAAKLQRRIENSKKPTLEEIADFVFIVWGYGGQDDAIPYSEKALSLYPQSAKAHFVLGKLLSNRQKQRALELLQKAVELEPYNPEAHSELGWYYLWSTGENKRAEFEFREALRFSNNKDETAWQGLGHVFARMGRNEEAVEAFRNYLRVRKVPTQYDSEIQHLIEKLERVSNR